jgi:tungstate transport system ATP-binding protein
MTGHMAIADKAVRKPACILPLEGRGLRVVRDGRAILDGVDIVITDAPRTTVILGSNGAGKSVLVRVLSGLVPPDEGFVTWSGSAPDQAKQRRIGLLLQRPVLLRRTALANVIYALALSGVAKSRRRNDALNVLERASLLHLAGTPAPLLSGGEQQRLALVRTLALKPDILILDEPAASLDPASVTALEHLIGRANTEALPILLITHDLAQARRLAADVIFMHKGRIAERGPAAQFFASPRTRQARAFLDGDIA